MAEVLRPAFSHGLTVVVSASVLPSEDPTKVLSAVESIFGSSFRTDLVSSAGRVEATYEGSQSLNRIYEQVRSRMTISVLRRLLRLRSEGASSSFLINKQVAARGVVVLCENEAESPLGAITVVVQTDRLDDFIDWISPDLRRKRSFRRG